MKTYVWVVTKTTYGQEVDTDVVAVFWKVSDAKTFVKEMNSTLGIAGPSVKGYHAERTELR